MNNLNTTNPNNYEYTTKHLEIHILGGIKTNKLESLRITLSILFLGKPTKRGSLQFLLTFLIIYKNFKGVCRDASEYIKHLK